MNYIILNGKKSNEIKGLLISELPPIVKPAVRTDIEEIDGRDGDIITKLGYSAYDREMTIGLFGNYDIDEVIEFFDSEGSVIFSNEATKLYKYCIIDEIDFERLAKFKTATVTFHCQPFKFSAVDNELDKGNNYLVMGNYKVSGNGMVAELKDGYLYVEGRCDSPTEFMIPIKSCHCKNGLYGATHSNYSVRAQAVGDNVDKVGFRICLNAPANPTTLGYTIMYLSENVTSQTGSLNSDRDFNYIYLYIQPDHDISLKAVVVVNNDDFEELTLFNRGNAIAKPIYKIYGSGTISLKLNGVDAFVINSLSLKNYIVLDTVEMNAYCGDTLLNRAVSGEYSNLWLKKGTNVLSWTGNVSKIEVDEYSRWV